MDHARIGHHYWDACIEEAANEHLVEGFGASRVVVGCHDEACLAIVILVLVQDAIEVRELPRENVGCKQKCWNVKYCTSLSKSSDVRRKSTNDSTDQRVV